MKMKIKSLVAGGMVAATAMGASVALAGPASATTQPKPKSVTAQQCLGNHDDAWPDWVNGRPAGLDAGDNGGVYLWHDTGGWHLVVTHRGDDRKSVSGVIQTRGRFFDVHGVALEKDDKLAVSKDHHRVAFRFVNYGHIDGLTFKTVCAPRLGLGFKADGHRLGADRVVIGHDGRHPASDPFTIARTV
ncbi:MAG: hypothetical protein JOZ99_13910 [Actinobacteria bacterium]|nr:hypothetical protein [Actinomycetota bacterium]